VGGAGRRLEHQLAERRGYPFGCSIRFVLAEMVVPGDATACEDAASANGVIGEPPGDGQHSGLHDGSGEEGHGVAWSQPRVGTRSF
jgi:hypothetical protein